jgi:hypothetical protein
MLSSCCLLLLTRAEQDATRARSGDGDQAALDSAESGDAGEWCRKGNDAPARFVNSLASKTHTPAAHVLRKPVLLMGQGTRERGGACPLGTA